MLWRRALWLFAEALDAGKRTSTRLVRFLEEDLDSTTGVGVAPWLVRGVWYSLPSEIEAEAGVGAVDESRLSGRVRLARPLAPTAGEASQRSV